VNVTASLAVAIVSNSTVVVHAVATVMIPVLAVLPVPRKNTYLEVLDGMAS